MTAPQHANASARQPVSVAQPSTLPHSDAPVFAPISTGEAAATPPLQACAACFSWLVLPALLQLLTRVAGACSGRLTPNAYCGEQTTRRARPTLCGRFCITVLTVRPCMQEFNRRFRHEMCAMLVRQKVDADAGDVIAAMLQLSRPHETRLQEDRSAPLAEAAITALVAKSASKGIWHVQPASVPGNGCSA